MSIATPSVPAVVRRAKAAQANVISKSDALPLIILAAAFGRLLYLHGERLWNIPHYEFFPLVIIGSSLLVWQNVKRLGPLSPGRFKWLTFGLAVVSGLLLLAATLLTSYSGGVVAFLVALLAFAYSYGGWTLLKAVFPAWIFLWLAVPPPNDLDGELIRRLQSSTASWSGGFLDIVNILHLMKGNVVEIPGQRLMVETACSGIQSLFAILTCSLFFIFWSRRGVIHSILLILGGIGWVLAGNVVRVVTIAIAQTKLGIDLATGMPHTILGFVIFAILLMLVWSLDNLLMFIFGSMSGLTARFRNPQLERAIAKKKLEKAAKQDLGSTRWPPLAQSMLHWKPVLGLFAVSALLNGTIWAINLSSRETADVSKLVDHFDKFDERTLDPEKQGYRGWKQIDFRSEKRDRSSINGEFSKTWTFRQGDIPLVFSLDYAWDTFHELTVCYKANGWEITFRDEHLQPMPDGGPPDHLIEVELKNAQNEYGYLLFTGFDYNGRPVAIRSSTTLKDRILSSFNPKQKPIVYQVQAFSNSFAPYTPEQKKSMMDVYTNLFRRAMIEMAPGRSGR